MSTKAERNVTVGNGVISFVFDTEKTKKDMEARIPIGKRMTGKMVTYSDDDVIVLSSDDEDSDQNRSSETLGSSIVQKEIACTTSKPKIDPPIRAALAQAVSIQAVEASIQVAPLPKKEEKVLRKRTVTQRENKTASLDPPKKKRKKSVPFTVAQVKYLFQGVNLYGRNWTFIRSHFSALTSKTTKQITTQYDSFLSSNKFPIMDFERIFPQDNNKPFSMKEYQSLPKSKTTLPVIGTGGSKRSSVPSGKKLTKKGTKKRGRPRKASKKKSVTVKKTVKKPMKKTVKKTAKKARPITLPPVKSKWARKDDIMDQSHEWEEEKREKEKEKERLEREKLGIPAPEDEYGRNWIPPTKNTKTGTEFEFIWRGQH